jgi:hypothetical protein
MIFLRSLISKLLYGAVRASIPLLARLVGYRRWSGASCVVWGPQKIVEQAKEAILYLEGMDDELFSSLRKDSKIILWYDKGRLLNCHRVFTICDTIFAWGRDGIIARTLQCFLVLAIYPNRPFANREEGDLAQQKVMRETYEWLKQHRMADGLTKQYAEWAGIEVATEHGPV